MKPFKLVTPLLPLNTLLYANIQNKKASIKEAF